MYELLGRLMGVAIRTKNPLPLDLPSFFWKPLVGQALDRRDLELIDYSVCHSWAEIEKMSAETFQVRQIVRHRLGRS